jgi:hypothetical protein
MLAQGATPVLGGYSKIGMDRLIATSVTVQTLTVIASEAKQSSGSWIAAVATLPRNDGQLACNSTVSEQLPYIRRLLFLIGRYA